MNNNSNNNDTTLSVYSDYLNVSFNIYNVTLVFGTIENDKTMMLGKIKLSPETAKSLLKHLDENVKTYEEIYGTINVFDDEARAKEQVFREKLIKEAEEKSKRFEELRKLEEVNQTETIEEQVVVEQVEQKDITIE